MPFCPLRFRHYANDLSAAIYALALESREAQLSATHISRLKDKLTKAAGVAQRTATAIEAEADALIAEENVIKAKTTDAFAPHKAILAEATTELQAIKDVLNLMSNGGPPLEDAPPESETPIAPVTPYGTVVGQLPVAPAVKPDDTGSVEQTRLSSIPFYQSG